MITPGTYIAVATGASIYESAGGALMLALGIEIPTEAGEPERITSHQCLVQKDGTISTITVDTCKRCWGWDGHDPFWLTDSANLAGKEVEIVVIEESYTAKDGSTKTGPKVRYINPPGGGSKLPENADRNAVLAKYGAKFRALSGGVPAKKPAPAPKAPPAPSVPPPPPARMAAPSSMEEAWNTLNETMAGKDRKAIETAWFAIVGKLFPGKSNSDLTPEEWGAVKAACEDNVPY